METPRFIIPGNPIAWQRANPGKTRMYDAQKKIKLDYTYQIQSQYSCKDLLDGPLELDITFYFRMPPSHHKHFDKLRLTPHHFRPDLSNLVKLIEDVGSGVLYKDDSLIASLIARKLYDDNPRIEFFLKELHGKKAQ